MTTIENTARLSRNAMEEIVDIEVRLLGISYEHLVRPIVEEDVEALAETDETEWDPIEVRAWPDEWEKPAPQVLFHVVSGNHRTRAARKKGLATLRGMLKILPDDLSYTVAAVKSNTRHGKNFTQEQRLGLAKTLSEQGLSLAEIAKVFGVHKSTVGNWLSGRDSNASKKKDTAVEEAVAYATAALPTNEVTSKLLGWLAVAPISLRAEDARRALRSLPDGMQLKARQMKTWLAEVMQEEDTAC
jgi:transcriptional regulator with XRE-family HTH domain